jgi:RNA polymerase sigma-70 factor (ECF subfamily)
MSELDQTVNQVMQRSASLTLYARQWLDGIAAEDAVQDALASLLSQSRPPEDPVAWMYRSVRNTAIDRARATSRRTKRERSVAQGRREWFEEHPGAAMDAESAEEALRQLPADAREIVVLRIWGGLGFAQVAEVMGISLSAAHKRYVAAIEQLRVALENPCRKNNRTI